MVEGRQENKRYSYPSYPLRKLCAFRGIKYSTTKVTKKAQNSQRNEMLWKRYFHSGHCVFSVLIVVASLLFSKNVFSQSSHFAKLSVSTKKVITGQSFNVRITVYTPTWFTKAPDFGEYQVRHSFTVRTDRPQSMYETINGKRYTTLYYDYIVFPLKAGTLELPPLKVEFESPAEGDYKGKAIAVTTNSASLEVLPIPENPENNPLFVASYVSLTENWNSNFSNLKVGDVLERTIRISSSGTLGNMIPPLDLDSITWASRYSGSVSLSQNLKDKSLSSQRIEKYTYLLEEEGSYTLPEISTSYYHIQSGRWIRRTIPSKTISIAPNPDLYALKTLQDSLNAGAFAISQGDSKPLRVLGMSIKKFMVLLASLIVICWVLILIWKQCILWYKAYRKRYLVSERYYFRQLLKVLQQKDYQQIDAYLYGWLIKLDRQKPIITISELGNRINSDKFVSAVSEFHRMEYSEKTLKSNSSNYDTIKSLKKQLLLARKSFFQYRIEKRNFMGSINFSQHYRTDTNTFFRKPKPISYQKQII